MIPIQSNGNCPVFVPYFLEYRLKRKSLEIIALCLSLGLIKEKSISIWLTTATMYLTTQGWPIRQCVLERLKGPCPLRESCLIHALIGNNWRKMLAQKTLCGQWPLISLCSKIVYLKYLFFWHCCKLISKTYWWYWIFNFASMELGAFICQIFDLSD